MQYASLVSPHVSATDRTRSAGTPSSALNEAREMQRVRAGQHGSVDIGGKMVETDGAEGVIVVEVTHGELQVFHERRLRDRRRRRRLQLQLQRGQRGLVARRVGRARGRVSAGGRGRVARRGRAPASADEAAACRPHYVENHG